MRQLRRAACLALALTACGSAPSRVSVVATTTPTTNAIGGVTTDGRLSNTESTRPPIATTTSTTSAPPSTAAAQTVTTTQPVPPSVSAVVVHYDWDAIAQCETGGEAGATPGSGNWTAHGSAYSSALGVMNQAVRENAPPDVADRILNGTASRDEQIAMAESIAQRHGIHSWTCGRKLYP